jgi:hypothetical protein
MFTAFARIRNNVINLLILAHMKKIFAIVFFSLVVYTANSQVLISLLFGDKLNTPALEFGLEGGASFLNMSNTPGSKNLTSWNLGFYFNILVKPQVYIYTGVLVKGGMGCAGLAPYSLDNADLDSAFVGGSVDRYISYFDVPIMLKYRFKNHFEVSGGIQAGLRYKAVDVFSKTYGPSGRNEDNLVYDNNDKDNYAHLDFGLEAGLGYLLPKVAQGMTISAKYYYGLVDVNLPESGHQNNQAIYLNAAIPIGKKKAQEKAAAAKAAEEKTGTTK